MKSQRDPTNQPTATEDRPPQASAANDPARAAAARSFAIEAAKLAADTRCHTVTILDVTGISPVTDFFVLATGTSSRQMRTVAEQIEEFAEAKGFKALSRAGYDEQDSNWILVDFVDVVVHVFTQEARMFYDLDGLWGDAARVEWKPAGEAQKDA